MFPVVYAWLRMIHEYASAKIRKLAANRTNKASKQNENLRTGELNALANDTPMIHANLDW